MPLLVVVEHDLIGSLGVWRRTLLPSTPIRQIVLVHIVRRWLADTWCKRMGFVRVAAGDK